MATPTVGYAVMPVVPSLKGMDAELRRQLGGPLDRAAKDSGRKAGKSFRDGFGELNIDSQSLTSFGTKAVAVGGIVAFGLGKAGKAAGDLNAAIASSGQVFGDQAGQIEAWSKNSAESIGLSQRAAVQAATGFAVFGNAAKLTGSELTPFATGLAELAADMSAFANTSPEDAVTAISAALRGEFDPIEKYGVMLNELTLKEKARALGIYEGSAALTSQQKILAAHAVIMEDTTHLQGQFAREQGELGAQTAIMKANWEDASAALGEALLPAMTGAARGASDLLGSFQQLNPEAQSFVSKMLAVGAGGAVLVGGLSLAAGAGLKLADAYGRVKTAAANGNVALARTATVGRLAGKALGAAGLAFAVYEAAAAMNEASRDAVGFETAVLRLKGAAEGADISGILADAASKKEGLGDDIADTFNRLFTFQTESPSVQIGEYVVEIDNLQRALKGMWETDPEQLGKALAFLDENMTFRNQLGVGDDRAFAGLNKDLDTYRENLAAADAAEGSIGTGFAGNLNNVLGFANATELAAATEEAAKKATDALSASMARLSGRQQMARLGFDSARVAAQSYTDAIGRASSGDDLLRAGLGAGGALADLRKGLFGEAEAAEEAEEKTDTLAAAVDALSDAMSYTDPKLSRGAINLGQLAAAAGGFRDSLKGSSKLATELGAALDLGSSYRDLFKMTGSARRLPQELDVIGASLGLYGKRQAAAIQDVLALGSATTEYLATLLETGRGTAYVRSEADRLRAAFVTQFRQAGLNEQAIGQYVDALNLTPAQVETAIRISGVDAARFEIESYLSLLQGRIPENIAASVTAQISAGNLEGAADQLAALAARNPVKIPVEVDEQKVEKARQDLIKIPSSYDYMKAALGGYSEAEMRGLEAVMALGDQAKATVAEVLAAEGPEAAADAADRLREKYRALFAQIGITGDEFEVFEKELLGLDEADVEMSIKLAGFDQTVFEIETLLGLIEGDISSEQKLEIAAAINAGDYVKARALIDADLAELTSTENWVVVKARMEGDLQSILDPVGLLNPRPSILPIDADTEDAERLVGHWRRGEEANNAEIPIDADDIPAIRRMNLLRFAIRTEVAKMPVDLDTTLAELSWRSFQLFLGGQKGFTIFGGMDGNPATPMATGGLVPGFGSGDTVPAMLTPGEFVITKSGVQMVGTELLERINSGRFDALASSVSSSGDPRVASKGGFTIEQLFLQSASPERSMEDIVTKGPAYAHAAGYT